MLDGWEDLSEEVIFQHLHCKQELLIGSIKSRVVPAVGPAGAVACRVGGGEVLRQRRPHTEGAQRPPGRFEGAE